MIFRKATYDDVERISEIISHASRRLGSAGIDQWQRGYPNRQSVETDVENGVGMVLCLGNEILAYGAVIFSGERAYDDITNGHWLTPCDSNSPTYAVIHRLCVSEIFVGMGFAKQFMLAAESMAQEKAVSMRIDTHPDNRIMQGLIASLGYSYCGDVVIESRRLAYERLLAD